MMNVCIVVNSRERVTREGNQDNESNGAPVIGLVGFSGRGFGDCGTAMVSPSPESRESRMAVVLGG
jgi:hypothetical protein